MSAPTAHRIQRSKLLRPAPSRWELARPRLIEQLNEGLHAPLSVITGIAGSGKTSLMRDWAASLDQPSAWISLDTTDNELRHFLDLLAAATTAVYPPLGNSLLADLTLKSAHHPADLAIVFGDEILAYPERVVLILDDFHTISSPEIFDFFEFLLQFPPPNLHVCFVTRTDPPLPLLRYKAKYAYAEIRLAQLLFNREETEAFLGLAVPGEVQIEAIDQLQSRTEGWIAGLQLAALAFRQYADGDAPAFGMNRRAVADSINYIGDEIVQRQSADVKRVLMHIAVPNRFSAGLAATLLDEPISEADAQRLLESFEDQGLFLTALGEDRTWFRFHPLFRETLLEVFEREEGPEAIAQVHGRASRWFAERDQIGAAISHAMAAGNAEGAVEILEENVQRFFSADRWREIEAWLQLLPVDLRRNSIELTLAQGWVHQTRGAYDALRSESQNARQLLDSVDPAQLPVEASVLESEIALLESIPEVSTARQEPLFRLGLESIPTLAEKNRYAYYAALYVAVRGLLMLGRHREALSLLEQIVEDESVGPDLSLRHRESWAILFVCIVKQLNGDLQGARESANRQLTLAGARGSSRMRTQAHSTLGRVAYELNDLPTAVEHLRAAVDYLNSGIIILVDSALSLALAASKAGDPDLAATTIDQLLSSYLDRNVGWEPVSVRSFQARLAWNTGNQESALAWARSAAINLEERSSFTSVESPQISQTLILLGDSIPENRERGRASLDYLEPLAAQLGARQRMIELRLMRAFDLERDGRTEAAFEAMGSAIEMANGHIRTFLDMGTPFERLFRQYSAKRGALGHGRVLLAALSAESGSDSRPYIGPPRGIERSPATSEIGSSGVYGLSLREVEILDLLGGRLSNKEIADQLSISTLTVKRHTSNIYQKLGVSSRRQAVYVARAFSSPG